MAKQEHSSQPTKSDERNLVKVDDSYEGASLEDRLFLFWNKYSKLVIGGAILVVLIIVGREALSYTAQRAENRIQESFLLAEDAASLRAFAEAHPRHSLAGVALLRLADLSYDGEAFARAAEEYARAARNLREPVLRGRALLGQAFSLVLDDRTEQGKRLLEDITRDTRLLAVQRAEANYHLAVLHLEAGNVAEMELALEAIATLDDRGFWANRAFALRSALPPAP